ncbi:23S rRNA (adenine(2503)-C(2))-methyltransferase RlmN [Ruminococcaceae bacterium OttesenSCG-928-I18]|nr:23S rRNA (adenine(2503)-C(2))-methyltransferase RlmN [Ruminococcaceae bacterium OttesenSCG-928-I18]
MGTVCFSDVKNRGDGPQKQSLSDLSHEQLEAVMDTLGQPGFRAGQLFTWLHQKRADSFAQMSNLPAGLRERLREEWYIEMPVVAAERQSADGTKKALFRLRDGHCIESVLMRYQHGNSLCISTQVGCRMGCRFCASTRGGLVRNLTPGEMLGQVYAMQNHTGLPVSHVVLMGIGEPLDNFENVLAFYQRVTDRRGQDLSGRNLSLSTCGLVPQMERLAEYRLPLTLSVSLHAADDETRQKLMPVADRYPLGELLKVCRAYQKKTGRRISFEYAVVPGVNDRQKDAEGLSHLLGGMGAHLNLIAVNPTGRDAQKGPDRGKTERFQKRLTALGLNATVRRSLGTDIEAACGQLRAEYASEEDKV